MKFYVCPVCGNVIYMMNGDVSRVRCCGKEMVLLVPNTVDASHEKHVPLCNVSQNKVEVEVARPEFSALFTKQDALWKDGKFVAAITLISTSIGVLEPTLSMTLSSNTLNSLTCTI